MPTLAYASGGRGNRPPSRTGEPELLRKRSRKALRGKIVITKLDDLILAAAQKRGAELNLPYYGAISPQEAHALLEALANARLIDVRTRPEWEYVGHVPGSILIEWTTYPNGERNPHFLDELRAAAADPEPHRRHRQPGRSR